jgi:hypothetical protein
MQINQKSITAILVLMCILLAACATNPTPDAAPLSAQATEPQTATPVPPTATHTPTQTLTPTPTPTELEFHISASNFRREQDTAKVDVCIDLPELQDWMISDANLLVKGSTLPVSGGELLQYTAAAPDGTTGRRCDALFFELPLDLQLKDIVLQVLAIAATPREGEYCKFLLETVQPTLEAGKAGIQITCSEEAGYSNAKVIAKPDNLSQAEAEATAFSPVYFTVYGTWSFPAPILPTVTPFPTVALDDPNAAPYAIFQTLNQELASRLVEPGWVYTREDWEHDFDQTAARTLDDGTVLPQTYQRETWYHIDDTGRVDQSVSALRDPDGNVLETSVFSNGQYQTSTSPDYAFEQKPYILNLNELYLGNLIANLRQGKGSAAPFDLDDQSVIRFTLMEEIPNPDPPEYNQAILSDEVSADFSPETGLVLALKTVVTLADGTQRTFEGMRLSAERIDEPPEEVIELLQNAPTP